MHVNYQIFRRKLRSHRQYDEMRKSENNNKSFNSGLDYHALFSALFWMVLMIVLILHSGWSWLLLGIGYFAVTSTMTIWHEQIKFNHDGICIRRWNLKWKCYTLEQFNWAHFEDDGGMLLNFTSDHYVIEAAWRYKPLIGILKREARQRIPYFGYKVEHHDEMNDVKNYGCSRCHRIHRKLDIKSWVEEERRKTLFKKVVLKFPTCPNCRSPSVLSATDSEVAMTKSGLVAFDKHMKATFTSEDYVASHTRLENLHR